MSGEKLKTHRCAILCAMASAILAGCTVPTMSDPQTPADIARAAQVTEHTVVDRNERYSDPVDGRCADGLVPVRVAAWMEMAGEQVGGYHWARKCMWREI